MNYDQSSKLAELFSDMHLVLAVSFGSADVETDFLIVADMHDIDNVQDDLHVA